MRGMQDPTERDEKPEETPEEAVVAEAEWELRSARASIAIERSRQKRSELEG